MPGMCWKAVALGEVPGAAIISSIQVETGVGGKG